MEEKNNPLSPHLQIYKWQISSLLSITHRIVGVINILAITNNLDYMPEVEQPIAQPAEQPQVAIPAQ